MSSVGIEEKTASPALSETNKGFKCRFCGHELKYLMVDLGMSPLCERIISSEQLNQMEPFYPLHVYVCDKCWLAQLEEYVSREEIFLEYDYFSSYSSSWLSHCKSYVDMISERLELNPQSFVVELASNDGYLLQYFADKKVPVLGIEPAVNVAAAAIDKGIPTVVRFFGEKLAGELVSEYGAADLIIGNNVLAQVPDLNDFAGGMKMLLKSGGVVTMEFPHLMCLIEGNQLDTIYHEHFSYFSLMSAVSIFKAHGMRIFDVDQLWTHGGSLRIYACHDDDRSKPVSKNVKGLLETERSKGYDNPDIYLSFAERSRRTKRDILEFLISIKRQGKTIAGYGAPGKGNTLLNYCGIRTDFLDYTVDRNPYKHGKFTPGTHIPIYPVEKIQQTKPDYLFVLPWNFKDEILAQMSYIRKWGGKFIIPIPEIKVYS